MVAGIYDIFNHICEQYFSGDDDNTSDYLAEALMKSVIHASRIAVKNPEDYEARSNLMWSATWALNTLIAKGKLDQGVENEQCTDDNDCGAPSIELCHEVFIRFAANEIV
jgi:alcohol dehydrogenase YqhD (iron-dependent ADH family)